MEQSTTRSLLNLRLSNPVIVGSGLLTDRVKLIRQFADIGAGAVVTKTLYPSHIDSQDENIYPLESGMLNNTTYSKRPIQQWLLMLKLFAEEQLPIIVSVHANTPEGLAAMAGQIATVTDAPLELGISCPHDLTAGEDTPDRVYRYTDAVRRHTDAPFSVKLALGDELVNRVEAAVSGGAQALTLSDTISGLAFDPVTELPALGGPCGYSGAGIKPLVLAAIYHLRKKGITLPIIGSGGVQSGRDVRDYLLAGADAVQVYTALHYKCGKTLKRIIDEYQGIAGIMPAAPGQKKEI
ncbi:dihydroorotate dehydrogenase [Sodalis ligni]|uniref:dihydroorotate dehydrogenase n=1 Tax=Sodalis TaxID=84565 RepID=UPI00193FC203|nr:dihydroorotate dehydrogenase [Sodalis ligni]QWA13528.1 dihydroorotate dehydrogenase [Sodalis ligni]